MDEKSKERLEKVHPELARRVTQLLFVLADLGYDVRVVQGTRTFAEQDALFDQGRTKPGNRVTNARGGQSNHNFGLAVDVCPFKNNQPNWNDTKAFQAIGREAKKLSLEWGGDWKMVDMPHVQLKGMSVKECQVAYTKGGLPAVWARMDALLKGAKPTAFIPKEDQLIEFGDQGAAVKNLQKKLVTLGYLREHEIDGEFGKITKHAIISFQRQHNSTADGIVGPGTQARLSAALSSEQKQLKNLPRAEIDPAVVPAVVQPASNSIPQNVLEQI